LSTLCATKQEVLAVQVLAPDEVEPERLGAGGVRLRDAESGYEIETTLDAGLQQRYRENLDSWTQELREQIAAKQGRFVRARSDDDLERLFVRDWRHEGLIG
jgi:hypothetical protein